MSLEKKEIVYLDNSATTPMFEEAISTMALSMKQNFANPSSLHSLGMKSETAVKGARQIIASSIGANLSEIYFTSGGTESNNIAILGYYNAHKKDGNHIITTKIEHPSVLEPIKMLESQGVEVSYIGVNEDGQIIPEQLENALRADTILLSIMHVNNEVGSMQHIENLKPIIVAKSPKCALHVDNVQGFMKVPISVRKSAIDLMSISSHKIHGPKGVGALFVSDKIHVKPIVFGGHQEKNLRSGTEAVHNIIGFGKAVEISRFNDSFSEIIEQKKYMQEKIKAEIDYICINTPEISAPHILNVSFLGVRSEILLHSLEANNVFVSTGSACSSNKPQKSPTLIAMGKRADVVDSAIRFSFSMSQEFKLSYADMDYAVDILKKQVESIRKTMRFNPKKE